MNALARRLLLVMTSVFWIALLSPTPSAAAEWSDAEAEWPDAEAEWPDAEAEWPDAEAGRPGVDAAGGAEATERATAARERSKPGPYRVGVRRVVLVDESREDAYAGGQRTLVTDIWYPAVDEAEAPVTRFSDFFAPYEDGARDFVEHFGGELAEVNRRFRCVALRDVDPKRGRFPLLVFSHGNGGVRHQNAFQLDHLASHGYVIAACDHPGNAGLSPLPERALPYDRRGRQASARARPRDVSFVIDRLLALGKAGESWLAGRLDADRIGVLGHSFGGFTACRAVESDPRIDAILPMTLAYGRATDKPLLLMLGGRDATVGAAGNAVSTVYYEASTGPKHLLELKRGGHFSFTDMDRINPGFGDGIEREEERYLPMPEAKALICAYGCAFFDAYLKGDAAARTFLEAERATDELGWRSAPAAAPQKDAPLLASVPDPATGGSPPPGAKRRPPPPRTQILLVTGLDVPAHRWRETTPETRRAIELHSEIEVRVAEDPAILESSRLDRYAAIVINFRNHPKLDPGPRARANLQAFVKSGGGLVVLHFGVYAFSGWEEYAAMLGRVWVGKQSGKKISGHDERKPFELRVKRPDHPIVRGLPETFRLDDELMARLVGDRPIDVLLEAKSEYSGRVEPLLWTRSYGEGRVVVSTLGHDAKARQDASYQRLLRQSVAWAARVVAGASAAPPPPPTPRL